MNGEELAPISSTLTVNPLELRGIREAGTLAARQCSDSQLFSPAASSSVQNPASADRTHALTKTVRLRALTSVWLISTLHNAPLVRFSTCPI